jgi:SAM-dependent methyltransferase
MRNAERWVPTKVVRSPGGQFTPTSDPSILGAASRLVASRQIAAYEAALRRYARGVLLDMGCGTVPYLEMYRPFVDANVCVDWDSSLHPSPYLDETADLNEPLGFGSESFDTVLLTDVLEHIARPWSLFSEIARVLRPDGHVIVGVPYMYWLHEQPHDYYRYTEFGLRELARGAHLDPVHLVRYGGAPEILSDITAKCLRHWKPLCHLWVSCSGFVLDSRLGQRISGRTAQSFPLGYVFVAQKAARIAR